MKIALIAVAVCVALFGLVTITSLVGFNNTCVAKEQGIKAQYDQNRNNYDNFVKTIQEVAQVPAMYTADLEKVYSSAIKGRYGQDGSHAMLQFIKEHNPTFDSSLYTKVQQVVESGRMGFQQDQKLLIDRKRDYETTLGQFPGSVVASVFGFPRIDLDKYGIVTSDATEQAFETKKATTIQLRP